MHNFYKLIPHTADLGIEIWADDLVGLYVNSARALFDLIVGLDKIEKKEKHVVSADGIDKEDLLISFLNELIFLFATKKLLFSDFQVEEISDTHIRITAEGEKFDTDKHEIIHEIKAATYHDINIEKVNNRYMTRIIFDV